jgi:DNA-binding transcriptional LysR family regulator
MDFEQIRHFVVAAEYGKLTLAAERLFITQPALSRQLKALEQELGAKLFDRERGSRQLSLTYAGETFLEQAKVVLAQVDRAQSLMESFRLGASAVLRIAASPDFLRYVVIPAIAEFHKQKPDAEIQLLESDLSGASSLMVDGAVDLVLGPITPSLRDAVTWEALFTSQVYALVSPGHRLASRAFVTAEDLAGEDLLLFNSGRTSELTRELVFSLIHLTGEIPESVLESNIPETSFTLAAAGLGVAISLDIVPIQRHELRAIPILYRDHQIEVSAIVGWRRGFQLSQVATEFLELLRAYVGNRPPYGYKPWAADNQQTHSPAS